MKMRKLLCRAVASVVAMVSAGSVGVFAQKAGVPSRVVAAVDDSQTVRLTGNVHPLARAKYDQGPVDDGQPITHMMLLLQRSTQQEQTLRQLLDAQLTKSSASYQAWLTPEQFGAQFGPSDADVKAVTDWLTRQGFQVNKVSAGKAMVDFDGNAGQVRNAFHTQIHQYAVNGKQYFANASDPAIPEALAPVVKGIAALHNFPKHSQAKVVGNFRRDAATGQVHPLFTYTDTSGTYYAVGPADFSKIYNIPSTATGAGQSIAIVGQSNINPQDITSFRSMFGLPAYGTCPTPPTAPTSGCLNVIVNGPDPGLIGPSTIVNGELPDDELESDLDVEWAGGIAPQAEIIFVTSQTTQVTATNGVDLSALYIVDNNLAPILSESYGSCEPSLGTAGNAFYNAMWQQAAAQGIAVVIAAGDNGPAACDPDASVDPNAASQGLAVNGIASTPYNIAVGGTEFNQTASTAPNYWSSTNNSTTQLSALGYIPEETWDDSTCAANYYTAPAAAPCTSVDTSGEGLDISAGSGGPSSCAVLNGAGTACTSGYPKPAFQTNLTPADTVRDIPDVALFASNGFNGSFFVVCQSDANPNGAACDLNVTPTTSPSDENFLGVGGTSGATPSFAAILSFVSQATGQQRLGNANYALYALAAKESYASCNSSSFTNPASPPPASCVFYDITTGTNTVACDAGSPNCSNSASGYGVLVSGNGAYNAKPPNPPNSTITEGNPAFTAVTGYDLATGLGSVNVASLLNNWTTVTRTPTTTTLSGASATTVNSGSNFTVTISVSPVPPNGETVALNALNSSGVIIGSVSSNAAALLNGTSSTATAFTLSGGTVKAATNLLPPGTTAIQAVYGGDTTYAMSTSAPLSLTVNGTSSSSTTTLSFVTFNSNGSPVLSTGSQTISYGSSYILEIAVSNSSGQCATNAIPCPVGNITLTDNGNALNDWPNAQNANATNVAKVNNQGTAEDQPIQLGVGSHSLVASFAPSSASQTNYTSSTSNTLSVTVKQASTSMVLTASATSITPGASVTLTAYVVTNSSGAGPTGSISFTSNGNSIGSATCTPTAGTANINAPISQIGFGTGYCVATLTTTSIMGLYPPPNAGPRTPTIPRVPAILALLSFLLFVIGMRLVPQTRRRAYTYAGLLVIALLVGVVAGCGGGGGGSNSGGGTRTIAASYPGDTNYTTSNASGQIVVQ
jgi:Pro-kumamolisin, activation domain